MSSAGLWSFDDKAFEKATNAMEDRNLVAAEEAPSIYNVCMPL